MIFLADANVSPKAVRLLEVFDPRNEIRAHGNYFEEGTPDVDWMRQVAEWNPKPAIVCGDGNILRNKAEMVTLRDSDLMFVYLAAGWTNLKWDDFAWKIIKAWPSIVNEVKRANRATIYQVHVKTLKVELICLVSELSKKSKPPR